MTHVCHAVACTTPVPPKMLMCRHHWFMVPKQIRDAVWAEYRPGQEIDKRPSAEYMTIQRAAVFAVAVREGREVEFDQAEGVAHSLFQMALDREEAR